MFYMHIQSSICLSLFFFFFFFFFFTLFLSFSLKKSCLHFLSFLRSFQFPYYSHLHLHLFAFTIYSAVHFSLACSDQIDSGAISSIYIYNIISISRSFHPLIAYITSTFSKQVFVNMWTSFIAQVAIIAFAVLPNYAFSADILSTQGFTSCMSDADVDIRKFDVTYDRSVGQVTFDIQGISPETQNITALATIYAYGHQISTTSVDPCEPNNYVEKLCPSM